MRHANVGLLGLAVVLGVLAIWRSAPLFKVPRHLAAPPPARIASSASIKDAAPAPGSWHRSLFTARPSEANATAPTVTGSVSGTGSPKLVGVVINGDRKIAIIAYEGVLLRVTNNDKVGPWTVIRVEPHSTLLERAQTMSRLLLDPVANPEATSACTKAPTHGLPRALRCG